MGYQVIWTDEAIAELRQLVIFISRDNPAAAVKLGETLIQKSMILASHPRLGRMLRSKDIIRQLIIPPYRVLYEINDEGRAVYIRMLWHGARSEPEIK